MLARILGGKGFPRIQRYVLHAKTKIFCHDGVDVVQSEFGGRVMMKEVA